jgi:hypothetical protein
MLLSKYEECTTCDGYGTVEDVANDSLFECSVCHGRGEIEILIGEDEIVYVNVYEITREYGGPEEGGWWYNRLRCLETYPVRNKNSELMQEQLEKDYAHIKQGNIYSVLGGTELNVYIEERPKQSETKERPHYE